MWFRLPRCPICRKAKFFFPDRRISRRLGPYLRRTIAVPTKDLRRFILGFRLKANSELEATQVFGWYGDGTGMVYAWRVEGGGIGRARGIGVGRQGKGVGRQLSACPYGWEGVAIRITFLPIGAIGHCALGRGDAERSECPP